MTLEGVLNLNHSNDDYIMFHQGRNTNISDYLYAMYKDISNVKVAITDIHSGESLLDAEGVLWKNKIQPKYYTYYVDEYDLDSVLWDNVGRKVRINIENVTRCYK